MISFILPLLVLFSETGACRLSYDLSTPGYETSRLEFVLDYEGADLLFPESHERNIFHFAK